jgi:RNase adapter protein RapZ
MATARSVRRLSATAQRPDAHNKVARKKVAAAPKLVIITGMSGSGKASVLKAFEDMGYYCVDNLPVELIPHFAGITGSSEIEHTALVVDVREGQRLDRLPVMLRELKKSREVRILFLETRDDVLMRRFSETRRPHPLSKNESKPVKSAIAQERRMLAPIRKMADIIIDTSRFNVHELRAHVLEMFQKAANERNILVSVVSFGFRHGLPVDADLVFDVRFLPNPHFIPALRPFTGKHPKVARYIRSFPQTREFIKRIGGLLVYLLPHYVKEGKSYLTIAVGCTGGQHRSVMITEELVKKIAKAGYRTKVVHRDAE